MCVSIQCWQGKGQPLLLPHMVTLRGSMQTGDIVTLRQLHADGTCYRWHPATIESVSTEGFVVFLSHGTAIQQINRGEWVLDFHSRMHFWHGRWYILEELYLEDGTFQEIYVNINAPCVIEGNTISFVDYELDVSKLAGQPAQIIDQDEFAEAIVLYGYTEAHQRRCWEATHEAVALAEQWQPWGLTI